MGLTGTCGARCVRRASMLNQRSLRATAGGPAVGRSHAAAPSAASQFPPEPAAPAPAKLSEYGLFVGNGSTQQPAAGVIPYDLNSPLFSDYTDKFRFVKLPPGKSPSTAPDEAFEFPVGTVIAKTFAYPHDARDPTKGRRLLETRILKREADGWVGLPYIWNDEQTEAMLDVAGDLVDASWIDEHGDRAHQQLHHSQLQPVQGLPQAG